MAHDAGGAFGLGEIDEFLEGEEEQIVGCDYEHVVIDMELVHGIEQVADCTEARFVGLCAIVVMGFVSPIVSPFAHSSKMWANLWLVMMICSSISGIWSMSSSIRPKMVFSPIFNRGLGKFFVNSPKRVA